MGRIAGFVFVMVCFLASSGVAQAQTCSPPCREGFACVNGACVVACNPPCPAGEQCIDGVRCEPVQAQCNPPCREGFVCSGGRCVTTSSGPATPTTPRGGTQTPVVTTPAGGTATDDGGGSGGLMSPLSTLVKLRFGFGGEVDVEGATDDLIPTLGLAFEHDWTIRAEAVGISVGAMLSGLWWNGDAASDADIGRNTLIEIDVVPKVSYRVQPGLFVYGAVPVGITFSFLNGDLVDDAGLGFGWNLSVLAGVQYAMELIGVFIEMGVDVHNFTHSVDTALGEVDLDVNITQFGLNLGLAF